MFKKFEILYMFLQWIFVGFLTFMHLKFVTPEHLKASFEFSCFAHILLLIVFSLSSYHFWNTMNE